MLAAEDMALQSVVKATICIKNFDEHFPLVDRVGRYNLHYGMGLADMGEDRCGRK